MIPSNSLSSTAAVTGFSYPVKQPGDFLLDWELAGVALNDASQGLYVKLWKLEVLYNETTGLQDVTVSAPGVVPTVLFSGAGITEVALAFDQNMNPFVAYMQSGTPKIYWYDSTIPDMTTTALPAGCYDLRACLDEKRTFNISDSDIVLSYIRAGNLCVRYQRDRYGIEYVLKSGLGAGARLVSAAMNLGSRLQWRVRGYTLSDPSGVLVQVDPYLADVVQDILMRSGVDVKSIDVSKLWTPIEGYKIATEAGADTNIEPLMSAFFFDTGEWDKKIRFKFRGQLPVATITDDDLLETSGDVDAVEIERVQEVELLRKVNVITQDSSAGWVPTKQTAERRAATIKATGESTYQIPITCQPDFAAGIAAKRLRIPWGEPNKYKFGLGTQWSWLTVGDVLQYTDRYGDGHIIRIERIDEDGGKLQFEAASNANWLYGILATGVTSKPMEPTTPGVVGDTDIIVIDIPVQRDQDDELGYYFTAIGDGDGWGGGMLQMSADGGATVAQQVSVSVSATAGKTTSALLAEVSSEYQDDQVLNVTISDTLESVTMDGILQGRNLAAVQRADGSWELLQFRTVTQTGVGAYALSGLVRGRYATVPSAIPADARFVLIDGAVMFVPLQQWMLDQVISYRGVSSGQNPDDAPWQSFTATDPQSQKEWPPAFVQATRDGSDTVTVTWTEVMRLGRDTAPYHSKHMTGYRVKFSDGHTADVALGAETYTRISTPPSVTITVVGINAITGEGKPSEGITI